MKVLEKESQLKIYVASSWRNEFQPGVVKALREDGYQVYDFKDSDGFHWSEVDPAWKEWPQNIPKYLAGLNHPRAWRGFDRDMSHLQDCDVCVYVMPCGVSASLEAGWACGAGKLVIVYVPGLREPDLMVKMANLVTSNFAQVREFIKTEEVYRSLKLTQEETKSLMKVAFAGRPVPGDYHCRELAELGILLSTEVPEEKGTEQKVAKCWARAKDGLRAKDLEMVHQAMHDIEQLTTDRHRERPELVYSLTELGRQLVRNVKVHLNGGR